VERVEKRERQQRKQFSRLADRFLIALFVVEIFHLDGAHYEETRENWTKPNNKKGGILMEMFLVKKTLDRGRMTETRPANRPLNKT
jgi:hypothetical protein